MTHWFNRRAAPVALAVFVTFGCATVRAPAATMSDEVPVGRNGAEPQVELWLESGRPVSAEEKARATAEVRAALEQASATLVSDDGTTLLVVRAQGIARTSSRRADQNAAKVGMAVGAVAVVALVVLALVGGKGGGGGGKGGGLKAAPPRVSPRGSPRMQPVPRFRFPAASHGHSHGAVVVGLHADLSAPVPAPGPSGPVAGPLLPPEDPFAGARTADLADEQVVLRLPPPRPLSLEERKFFDKDFTRLELLVVERATGEPIWIKTVEGKVDPRDVAAVKRLLAKAIDDPEGWLRTGAPR